MCAGFVLLIVQGETDSLGLARDDAQVAIFRLDVAGGAPTIAAVHSVDGTDAAQLIELVETQQFAARSGRPTPTLAGDAALDPPIESQAGSDDEGPHLSARERQVLVHIASGLTHSQIATRMRISKATVDTYVGRIRRKIGAGNKADLTRAALSLDLIRRPSA